MARKSTKLPSNTAQTSPSLPNQDQPEAEQQVAHTKTQTIDAINSKVVPADQDMCQMKHVTEASSTEQQTGIGFMKPPWPSKAQLHFTSPEIQHDCRIDSASLSPKPSSTDEIDLENYHPEYSPLVGQYQHALERVRGVNFIETPASTRDVRKSLRIFIPKETGQSASEQFSNSKNDCRTLSAQPTAQRSVSLGVRLSYEPELPSPLSQFVDSDEQSSKSSLSDTELSLLEGFLESGSQIEHLHSLKPTRIPKQANLVPPSPCLNQENARPVQSENDIPVTKGAIGRGSSFEVRHLFSEIKLRVSATPPRLQYLPGAEPHPRARLIHHVVLLHRVKVLLRAKVLGSNSPFNPSFFTRPRARGNLSRQ